MQSVDERLLKNSIVWENIHFSYNKSNIPARDEFLVCIAECRGVNEFQINVTRDAGKSPGDLIKYKKITRKEEKNEINS